ncbi:RlpA-like double-psi beta-barrel domain-containing protein [Sporobolomyces salmoneus]|uniref:RlpA-like double-psi beta-barrel domain-containing protein n=1 Tax=Sporobolomyces salmoneus TaxID=183962 RepID=UPI00317954EB
MFSTTLLFAALSSVAFAAPISHIGTVDTPSVLPNATQYNTSVVYYEMNGRRGACGNLNQDSDKVVGLPLEWYSKLGQASPYCGEYVVVTNAVSNISVTAQVEDASTLNNTLSVSVATWKALNGSDDGLHFVNWRRANESEIALAKKAQSTNSVAHSSTSTSHYVAPSSTSTSHYVAPSSASKEWKAPVVASSSSSSVAVEHTSKTWTPSSSSAVHHTSSSSWVPSSSSFAEKSSWTPSSSAAVEKSSWTPSSSSVAIEEKKTSSTWTPSSSSWSSPAAKHTTTSTWSPEPTTTTSKWTPTTTQAPKETQKQASTSSFSGSYSGQATFYSQGGNAGSCGQVNGDYSAIVALNAVQMNGSQCGQWVTIKNTQNGKTVSAKVADTCPGCSYGSLDLSMGVFASLGDYDQGVLPITWSFN